MSSVPSTPTKRSQLALAAGLILLTALASHALPFRRVSTDAEEGLVRWPQARPRIEVAFVLDTTGSMSGLIEGAKRKIWTMMNQLADGEPRPEIRVALVAYRDRGDAYVTRLSDLTTDLDAVYATLQGFQAQGGGDTPESVNQALHEAVTRLDWSAGQHVAKTIFLVGDAPPHMDYDQEVRYPATLRLARERGIVVNTVQCGAMPTTTQVWQSIAAAGEGRFARVEQSGGMVAQATPMDEEMALLNEALADTVIAYGDDTTRKEIEDKRDRARRAPPEVAAARLSYFSKAGEAVISGTTDLLDAVKQGMTRLSEVVEEELPGELRAMEPEAREAYVRDQIATRRVLQTRISEVSGRRDAWIKRENARRIEAGEADGFDDEVLETLRALGRSAGVRY
jgi:uncharacterized protein YegL